MILSATRGRSFKEEFVLRNTNGKLMNSPAGDYRLTLERGGYVREFNNVVRGRNSITWNMTAEDTQALEYETLYFTLTFNNVELIRGVLRVQ